MLGGRGQAITGLVLGYAFLGLLVLGFIGLLVALGLGLLAATVSPRPTP